VTSQPSDGSKTPAPATSTFFLNERVSDAAMTYFYGHLFAAEPEISAMFPAAMDAQRQLLYRALQRIVVSRHDGELDRYLGDLGRAHRKFGVRTEHYDAFRTSMHAMVDRFAPPGWSADAKDEWEAAVDHAIEVMVTAATDDAAHAPAWWTAEVTAHELRTPQVAVLTLQPSEPFPYLPGQHLWVQTPRWPRLWRRYSIANAPREDGSLTLHVRAVAGGLVSNTLVHHLRPGDTLLLGPPGGRMTAETQARRPVLCLAGGTGLAPLKAVAEAIATSGAESGERGRDIVLYHGARTQSELYDLSALRRMELDYPSLEVIAATSDEMAEGTEHGTISSLAARADWMDRDVYISGPDAMIAKTVEVLRMSGARPELLRYDLPGETG
jgi:NAD(P)H-flavin reductase/hemoglobin-like flavoprotein